MTAADHYQLAALAVDGDLLVLSAELEVRQVFVAGELLTA